MSLYLVAGHGAATVPASSDEHLPSGRPRRYPSDTSDAEWQIMAGYIPAGGPVAGRGGGPVTYPRRDSVDAIRYLDHNSCVWRALPVDFPPWPTVYHYFRTWNRDGTLNQLHNGLREHLRQAEGRHAEPSAAILDSNRYAPRTPSPDPVAVSTPARRHPMRKCCQVVAGRGWSGAVGKATVSLK